MLGTRIQHDTEGTTTDPRKAIWGPTRKIQRNQNDTEGATTGPRKAIWGPTRMLQRNQNGREQNTGKELQWHIEDVAELPIKNDITQQT